MVCSTSAHLKHLLTDSAQNITCGVRHSPKHVTVSGSVFPRLHMRKMDAKVVVFPWTLELPQSHWPFPYISYLGKRKPLRAAFL